MDDIDYIRQKIVLITLLTPIEITSMYDNIRDYSTRSFYTGLLSVRHSPYSLIINSWCIESC